MTETEIVMREYRYVKDAVKYYCVRRGTPARPSPPGGALLTLYAPFDCHFWLEAFADGKWVTLDPSPDQGIACVMGDAEPGKHLEQDYRYIKRWSELPYWYQDAYNSPLVAPLRWATNIQIALVRLICRFRR